MTYKLYRLNKELTGLNKIITRLNKLFILFK